VKQIGTIIRDARKKRDLSQSDLSELSDVSQQGISDIEAGKRSPRLDTLILLARGLDMTLIEIAEAVENGLRPETPEDQLAIEQLVFYAKQLNDTHRAALVEIAKVMIRVQTKDA